MEPLYRRVAAPGAGAAAAGDHRGDILAILPEGRVAIVDCVVTHPAASSYVSGAAREAGHAAERAARGKELAYAALCQGDGYDFVPLALESYGRLGRAASRFLSDLGEAAAAIGRVSKASFVRSARMEISCALCRGNGRLYSERLASSACVGLQPLPGLAVPVDEVGDV